MECKVEVCNKNDASSKCNQAAAVCINDSTDDTQIQEDAKERYMCDSLCQGSDVCSVDSDIVSCKDGGIRRLMYSHFTSIGPISWQGSPPPRDVLQKKARVFSYSLIEGEVPAKLGDFEVPYEVSMGKL